jgi:DNA polymerase, archaea type
VSVRDPGPAKEPKYLNGFVDGADLVLLYRNERGEMLARRRRAEWSSFYRKEQVSADVLRDLRNSTFVVGVSEENEWVRVRWQAPEWRRKAHEPDGWAESVGLTAYEADVTPEHRFFAETGAEVAKPRRIYLDIETDSRVPPAVARQGKARVLCWSLVDEDEQIVAQGLLQKDEDDDERRVLEEFWKACDPYDQVVAWYGDGFDFPILKQRSTITGANFKDPRRWLWMDFMPVYERMNRNAAASGAEKESLRLQDVAMARLGSGKNEFDASKTYEEWAAGGERRQRLVDYCAQDTRLLPKLNKKTGFLDVNDAICAVGRLFADTHSADPTNYVDGFLLRMGVERGTRFPSRARFGQEERAKHEQFAGALVMKPKMHGIERDIHVADFSGMYPSIIITWNMSPETKRDIPINGPIPVGHCRAPSTRIGFTTAVAGILPEALKRVRDMRKYWQKKQASLPPGTPEWVEAGRLSTAYKVIANSFYGVIGSPFSRFFDRQIAESVTQNGVWLIQKTICEAEKRLMEVKYVDTDSLFVRNVTREAFDEFVRWCNAELYPPAIAECGCVENCVEIAYEKEFERLVFVASKKYCGKFAHYKWVATCTCDTAKGEPGAIDVRAMVCKDCGKKWEALPPPRGEPEIRGLEWRRGDVIRIARELQMSVIQKLMKDVSEDPTDFVPLIEVVRDHVLTAALSIEDVRLSKSLSKPLRDYKAKAKNDGTKAAEHAHVQVARILKARGEQVTEGTKIFYYVTDASQSPMKVAPANDYTGDPDRFYLWENLIYPATQGLLEAAFPPEKGMSADVLQLRDWRRFECVRPKKTRGQALDDERDPGPATARKGRVRAALAGQGGLFETPPALSPEPAPAPHTRPGEPFIVEVAARGRTTLPELEDVKAALAKHPGDRPVILRLVLAEGTVDLDLPMRVALSSDLLREVECAKGAA